MGTASSKNPDWYPGQPTGAFYGDCSCSQPRSSSSEGQATRETKVERTIASLPVVELMDMKFVANGAFCSVYLCKYQGHSVAAKRVREDLPLAARRMALDSLWTEFECLRSLSHPNIVDVYGLCRVKCREDYDEWNEKDVCLLLEELALGTVGHLFGTIYTVEKNLASAIAKSRLMKLVPLRSRLDRALELALALEHVHGKRLIHRDIKNMNVGFAKNGSLKLMDFGLSKMLPIAATEFTDTYQMTGEVGSFRYMAPEIVKHEPYNAKADIYSWSLLSWEIMAISKPYAGVTESTFIKRVVIDGERPALDKNWPDNLSKLLARAWDPDHKNRPTASQLVVALREIKAQLPAPRGSFSKRPSATTKVSCRRHSWSEGTSMRSLPIEGAVDQRLDSTVEDTSTSVVVSRGGHDGTSTCPIEATGGAGDMAAAAAAAAATTGEEKPENYPSASKPLKRFSLLARSSCLPARTTSSSSSSSSSPSSSSSSSRRTSWYKITKKAASAPPRFAREDFNRGSNPRPAESGSIAPVTAINPPLSTVVGSVLGADGRDDDGDQDAREAARVVAARSTHGPARCAFHQGLVARKEAIANTLAFEAKEQMGSPPTSTSSATTGLAAPSRKTQEATNFMRGRESATSHAPGDTSECSSGSSRVDALKSPEDSFGRPSRRSSVHLLWPSAPYLTAEKSEAPPISNGGGGDSVGESIGATITVMNAVPLTVSG